MAINGRLLRTSKQMGLGNNNGGQNQYYSLMNNYSLRFKCLNKGRLIGGAEKKVVVVATKAVGTAVVSEPITTQNWKISDGILDCRFFSLLAVAGTLIGSLLCFIEGCYLIIESYIHYFIAISHKSDVGHVVQLLIEAIDMFLLGTAMLTFGMGLYVMFVGSRNINVKGDDDDQLSGKKLYYFQTLPSLMGMKSVMQAKARIGHALIMLLQVGVLEKFKNIPVVNGLDLACFAAAVFVSSICVFILSRLAVTNTKAGD
ncbi:uncharacterized protein [Solanum lycopersicum]|uniref:uncharacterized protein isoform X2 n=1 Tax=Solanum lycopersicum TaxID=4081 RepID=UPI00374991E4